MNAEALLPSDDERYLIVNGRRWRRSDPAIPDTLRRQLVAELMDARRAVKTAGAANDDGQMRRARRRVQDAKVALGERGRAWWLVPQIAATQERIGAAMRALLRRRDAGKSICPSEAARAAGGAQWRELMPVAYEVAETLAQSGWLEITQRGKPVDLPVKGPIRLRKRRP